MSARLAAMLGARRLVVFVGEGGVGKTSTAAACALAAARAGRSVAALTIDPAPRLGDALGLGRLDGAPSRVVDAAVTTAGGDLCAMRLDTKRTFDAAVERLAARPEQARIVLQSPIYQALSGSLGGSDSYMALQQLHDLIDDDLYDLVVVDTPPALHADDLLSAPLRLDALMESRATAVLADPAVVVARAGSALARTTAAVLLRVLQRIAGTELRLQVAEFISSFEQVIEGLRRRARIVDDLLKRPEAAFVQVARPTGASVEAALDLRASLSVRGIETEAMVVNRMTPPPGADRATAREERMRNAPAGTLDAVARIERDLDALRASEQAAVALLRQAVEDEAVTVEIFSLEHDVTGIDDLAVIAARLVE